MEIRRWFILTITNCILIQYLDAKSVSLNELIAAETKAKQGKEKQLPVHTDREAEETSSNEILTAESKIKRVPKKLPSFKLPGLFKRSPLLRRLASKAKITKLRLSNRISAVEKLSPLSFKRAFQIKSPLKPKKLKVGRRLRHKRKNQSKKREINRNDNFQHQYIPVLKSLSMLFDNLLDSDTSDSRENKPKKYKLNRFYSEERFKFANGNSNEAGAGITKYRSNKKATTSPPTISTKDPSRTKNISSSKNYDYSTIRPNKSIPILFSRNTTSSRRDYNGTSKRSSTAFHRDIEGNITRDHGNNEYNSRCRENESCEKGYENHTYNATRNDSGGVRHSRGNRFGTRNSKDREVFNDGKSKNKNTNNDFGETQLEARGYETESESLIRKPVRRLREFATQDEISDERVVSNSIQPDKVYEKSILTATENSTCSKRIIDKGSPFTTKDENVCKGNETVILVERNFQINNNSLETGNKVPVVMIFDGYSVTRDKNGKNKVLGKTIHIHS